MRAISQPWRNFDRNWLTMKELYGVLAIDLDLGDYTHRFAFPIFGRPGFRLELTRLQRGHLSGFTPMTIFAHSCPFTTVLHFHPRN